MKGLLTSAGLHDVALEKAQVRTVRSGGVCCSSLQAVCFHVLSEIFGAENTIKYLRAGSNGECLAPGERQKQAGSFII
jgi:hypothetical protein